MLGIDLSTKMVREAQKKGVYDRTVVGEASTLLLAMRGNVSIVIASDSLVYSGNLTSIFNAFAAALHEGGIVTLTLESSGEGLQYTTHGGSGGVGGSGGREGWTLHSTGRFSHSIDYVGRVAKKAGLRVIQLDTVAHIRFERGVSVVGLFLMAQKHSRMLEGFESEKTAIQRHTT